MYNIITKCIISSNDYLNSITKHIGFKVETPQYKGDSLANSIGDTIFSILGWIICYGMFNKKLRYI